MQDSSVQVTRQPKGITVCWTRSRLCAGPVRTLQPSAATRYVSLFLAQAPELPVSTCSRCRTTLRGTAGATPPKVKITWDHHVYLSTYAVQYVHVSSVWPCECLVQRKLSIVHSAFCRCCFYLPFFWLHVLMYNLEPFVLMWELLFLHLIIITTFSCDHEMLPEFK